MNEAAERPAAAERPLVRAAWIGVFLLGMVVYVAMLGYGPWWMQAGGGYCVALLVVAGLLCRGDLRNYWPCLFALYILTSFALMAAGVSVLVIYGVVWLLK